MMSIYQMYEELSKGCDHVVLINPETKEIFMDVSEIPVDFASEHYSLGDFREL